MNKGVMLIVAGAMFGLVVGVGAVLFFDSKGELSVINYVLGGLLPSLYFAALGFAFVAAAPNGSVTELRRNLTYRQDLKRKIALETIGSIGMIAFLAYGFLNRDVSSGISPYFSTIGAIVGILVGVPAHIYWLLTRG